MASFYFSHFLCRKKIQIAYNTLFLFSKMTKKWIIFSLIGICIFPLQRFRTRKSRCFSPLNLSSPGLLRFPSRHPHAASWISEVALMHDSPHEVVAQTASCMFLRWNYGGLFFPLSALPQNPVQSNKNKLNITHIKQKLQYTDNLILLFILIMQLTGLKQVRCASAFPLVVSKVPKQTLPQHTWSW